MLHCATGMVLNMAFRSKEEHEAAIRASTDWCVRVQGPVLGDLDPRNRPPVGVLRRRFRSLTDDRVRVPEASAAECAGVRDAVEAEWLTRFEEYISDPASARMAEPYSAALLFGRPAPGFRSVRLADPKARQLERHVRASSGRLVGNQDAGVWEAFPPAMRTSWPGLPVHWHSVEVPFRLSGRQ